MRCVFWPQSVPIATEQLRQICRIWPFQCHFGGHNGGCDITLGCLVMSSTTSGELIEMQDLAPLPDIVVSSSANSYKTSPEAPNTN